jgi:nitroimidazol reductase NimA-like FMN-containing flavoprotein (pyridoxamine 5'-phosphate oxidase superfamily)
MVEPKVTRPRFPPGYVDHPSGHVAWSWVEARLVEAAHYWLCTVRPDGRPHAIPRWAVWVDGSIYFDGSPETRHARNLAGNPQVVVHLESGEQAVMLEGQARAVPQPEAGLAARVAAAYRVKYGPLGYAPDPDQWDKGGLFEVVPQVILAWTRFSDDPTKFSFERPGP